MDSSRNQERPQADGARTGDRQDGQATERIRRAIEAAAQGTGSRSELESAAKELVSQLRAEHERPEQMLLTIKRILADAGLRPTYSASNDAAIMPGTQASVYRDVIAWSIRHYYAETDGDGTGDGDGKQ